MHCGILRVLKKHSGVGVEAFFPYIVLGVGVLFAITLLRTIFALFRWAVVIAIILAGAIYLQGWLRVNKLNKGVVAKVVASAMMTNIVKSSGEIT